MLGRDMRTRPHTSSSWDRHTCADRASNTSDALSFMSLNKLVHAIPKMMAYFL